jgi:hypothetical protein
MAEEDEEVEIEGEAQIRFVLCLLGNLYSPEDIAIVAMTMADEFEESFKCIECGIDVADEGELFAVHKELRAEITLEDGEELCVGCFEERLGRELQYFDFTSSMIQNEHENHDDCSYEHSDKLKNRLISGLDVMNPE